MGTQPLQHSVLNLDSQLPSGAALVEQKGRVLGGDLFKHWQRHVADYPWIGPHQREPLFHADVPISSQIGFLDCLQATTAGIRDSFMGLNVITWRM